MIDYSKLKDFELEAIANNDYSKLSNKTLQLLANEPEKSALDKFFEPLEGISIKDWSEKSLLAPMLQTMKAVTPFGMLRPALAAQDLKRGTENLTGKGKQMAEGAYQIATNPVESAQKAYTAVTENPAGVAGEIVKGAIYDPEMLIGSGLGNVAERGLTSAGRAVGSTAAGIGDVVAGAVGTATNAIARPGRPVKGYQVPSERNPIGATFTPPEELAKFERGELPYGQLPEQRPISELPEGRLDKAALMMSGGNIPNAGKGARAFGERLGETYRNPYTAAADIASMFVTGGIPVLTAGRAGLGAVQGLADLRLAKKGFSPDLPQKLAEYQTGVRPMPGQPGPMPAAGAVAPNAQPAGMSTPAAQAAMATTQAKASQAPRQTRQPAQPRQQFTLPDAGTHYAMAEQGSLNFADTFNKAVSARTQDLLKNARQTGQKLTPELAEDLARKDIRDWRSKNVEAFKPKQETAGPVKPEVTAEQALAEFNPPKVDPELVSDQNIWARLQEKTKAGTPLVENEQTAVRRITNKYGQDPFQTGNLKGETVFKTADLADGYQVRAAMKMDSIPGITTKNKKLVINEDLFNDTAKIHGMPAIDWKKVRGIEDLNEMPVGEARRAIRKEINRQFTEANAYAKGPERSTQKKAAEYLKEQEAKMTPEELAAANAKIRTMDTNPLLKKLVSNEPKSKVKQAEQTVNDLKKSVNELEKKAAAELDIPVGQVKKLSDAELLAKIQAKRKNKPSDTMEMKTGGKVFDSKKDYESQVLLDKLADKPTTGSFVDNGLRYEITEIDYGNTPKDLLKRLNKPLTEVRVFSERTNNQISGPAPDVPEKSLRQRIQEQRKRK